MYLERLIGRIREAFPRKEKKEKTFDDYLEELRKSPPDLVQIMPYMDMRKAYHPNCTSEIYFFNKVGEEITLSFSEKFLDFRKDEITVEGIGNEVLKTFITALSRMSQIETTLGIDACIIDEREKGVEKDVLGSKIRQAFENGIFPVKAN